MPASMGGFASIVETHDQQNVAVIRDMDALRELEGDWNRLTSGGRFRAPFYSWAWQSLWWTYFRGNAELFAVVVRDQSGQVCAIAPLMKTVRRVNRIAFSELRFATNDSSARSSILFSEDEAGLDGVRKIMACISDHRREWDVVALEDIDPTMPYLPLLSQSARDCGLRVLETAGKASPYISIGNQFEQYLHDTFGSKHRYNLRREVRALSQKDYRIVEYTSPDDMERAMELAFSVASASWKGEAGSAINSSSARRHFFAEVAKHFAGQGQYRVWISFLGDCPIATQHYLTCGEKLYFLINDFRQEYAKLSPGTALLYHVIELLHNENVNEFDFCGRTYEYKATWATGVRRHVTIELYSNRCRSSLAYVTEKRILPALEPVKKTLRPVKRALRTVKKALTFGTKSYP